MRQDFECKPESRGIDSYFHIRGLVTRQSAALNSATGHAISR